MKFAPGCWCLVALGFLSCGGTSGSSLASPASVKDTPAGVSTLVFMDLELVRPDNLTGASSLPTGVNASLGATTLTFTNRKAANGGVINGTIMVAPVVSGGTTTFTETLQPDRHSGSAGERGHAGLDLVRDRQTPSDSRIWGVQTIAVTTTHATTCCIRSYTCQMLLYLTCRKEISGIKI